MHYILESTFARTFIILELPLQREIHINLHCTFLHILFFVLLTSFDNNLIMIGNSKQCLRSRKTRGVLKIER